MTRFGPDHERWGDAVGSYLLGAMPDPELGGFEAHLAECPACRDEVDRLRVAADALPVSVPVVPPPPELKDRIRSVVEAEASLLASADPVAAEPPRRAKPERRRRSLFGWLSQPAVALACALLLLVGGAIAGGVIAGGGDEPAARTLTADTTLPGAKVDLKIGDEGATLVARDMPAPPDGRVYQVWTLKPGGKPVPTTALWTPRADGSADVAVPGSLDGVQSVLVSAEPPGGSAQPTSAPVINAPTS
jgi:anti-sigma-K factor RskA